MAQNNQCLRNPLPECDNLVTTLVAADFTVLDEDPYAVDPSALNRIGVHDTVLGGKPQSG